MTVQSIDELLAQASSCEDVRHGDAKSGAEFARLVIDGDHYFLKRLSPSSDWVMRLTGDHVHRPYLVWRAGIMDQAPDCIDHTVLAMQVNGEGDDAALSILMRDVGSHLVPEGDSVVSMAQHTGFIEHLAALSAAFWGFQSNLGLATMSGRLRLFAPDNIAGELEADEVPGTIAAAAAGWPKLAARSPLLAKVAHVLHERPGLITEPMTATPATFLHGDWKMGNLGTHPDGRTILLDWALPGSGPACWDLCWYLALNQARLPEAKEAAIERFRMALERLGIPTAGWWEPQLDLCVIGIMTTFGWEKALGDDGELLWWERQVAEALRRRGLAEVIGGT